MGLADTLGLSKKRQDLESRIMRQFLLAGGIGMLIMMVSLGLFIVANAKEDRAESDFEDLEAKYELGEITEEYFKNQTAAIQSRIDAAQTIRISGMASFFGSMFIVGIWMGVYLLVTIYKFKDFMAERAGCDVFETTIDDDDLGPYKYQIITPRDSSQKVDVLYDFIEIIRKTKSFQSILASIEAGTHEVVFSEGNILQQMSIDLSDIKEKLETSKTFEEYIQKNREKKQNRENYSVEDAIIDLNNLSDKNLEDLIKIGVYKELLSPSDDRDTGYGWELIFRKVDEIKCLDGEIDKFDNLKGMYVLLPTSEKDLWAFHNKRRSNDEYMIPISKCYTHFKFIEELIDDKFSLFVCDQSTTKNGNLLNLKFNRTQIPEAEIEALSQFAYLAWIRSRPDDKKKKKKNTEIKALKGKLQAEENEKANNWLDEQGITALGTFFERKFNPKPEFQLGNLIMWILTGSIGFLTAMLIFR